MVLELVSFYNMPRYIPCYLSCITQQPKGLSINPYSSGLGKFVFNSSGFPNNACIWSFFFAKMNAVFCSTIPSQLETQVVILACRSVALIVPATHMDGSRKLLFHIYVSQSSQGIFSTSNVCYMGEKKDNYKWKQGLNTFQLLEISVALFHVILRAHLFRMLAGMLFSHLKPTAGNWTMLSKSARPNSKM